MSDTSFSIWAEGNRPSVREQYDSLLRWLNNSAEDGEHRYLKIRQKLFFFFLERGCHSPEDWTDEVLDRVARRLVEGEVIQSVPEAYVYGVARNCLREYWRTPQRKNLSLESELADEQIADDVSSVEQVLIDKQEETRRRRCLERCLDKLPEADRSLLTAWYQEAHSHNDLAIQAELTLTGLRTRVHRIRSRVAACSQRCLSGLSVSSANKV